jgi:hypothetical protein
MKKLSAMAVVILLLIGVMGTASVQASSITLSDGNSTAKIDPSSDAGMYSWKVDGNDVMYQQWFWYRVGTGGQQAINSIGTASVSQLGPRYVEIAYSNDSYKVDVTYVLTGGSLKSGTSDVAETIRITNLSSRTLDFHFFQYSDFDLMSPFHDSASFNNVNAITQKNQVLTVAETVVTPGPNHWSIKYVPALLEQLNGTENLTLSDTNETTVGDIAWAFEWDLSIDKGGTFIISKDKRIAGVPEPGILLLLGSGLIGALALRKKIAKN